ncbi:hypothetical protein ONE63_005929 [Megalurothrips usitatus]|uniref:Uncharacterized protein n=1 Tax=Megalurothrips usitatus TaxID=439358 RepID=A0AAV7Y494_9NEOP|nr:hypothetical protein ONE63_005929 [Megalurothrips usitatus]
MGSIKAKLGADGRYRRLAPPSHAASAHSTLYTADVPRRRPALPRRPGAAARAGRPGPAPGRRRPGAARLPALHVGPRLLVRQPRQRQPVQHAQLVLREEHAGPPVMCPAARASRDVEYVVKSVCEK